MIRWTPALLKSTYGEIRYGARFAPYERGYPRPAPTRFIDPEVLEKAHRAARAFEQYEFFVTEFSDPATGERVWNLLVGASDGGVLEFFVSIEESIDFLSDFDVTKLSEGEPIASVYPLSSLSLGPYPMKILGPPIPR